MPISDVFNMDCMEGMAQYPDKYFELAIVDPPYGIGFDKENTTMSAGVRKDGTKRKMKNWNNPKEKGYVKKNWDTIIPPNEYFIELKRISKNQIIWGGNYFTEYLKPHGGWIVWDKGVPDGMTLSQAELAYNTFLNSIKLIKILWAGYKKVENENRIHPTQKPVKLYKWLLTNYAKPGDKILDTHLGSGSSRIAAYDMGFDFVGFELDKEYFDASCKRFDTFKQQLKLF
jgi:site-specific DNA-methyltransferase (adenine-specific)